MDFENMTEDEYWDMKAEEYHEYDWNEEEAYAEY